MSVDTFDGLSRSKLVIKEDIGGYNSSDSIDDNLKAIAHLDYEVLTIPKNYKVGKQRSPINIEESVLQNRVNMIS